MKQTNRTYVVLLSWLLIVATAIVAFPPTVRAQASGGRTRVSLFVWDTGQSSAIPITAEALEQKAGWKPLAAEAVGQVFQGDAAIANGKLLAIARQQGRGVELYSLGSGKPVFRARLLPAPSAYANGRPDEAADRARLTLTESSRAAVGFEIACQTGTIRCRLKRGELFAELQAVAGTAPLRVECPSRFAVLPDFFADDILFDARKVAIDKVELPSENFLLHFTGKQDAIVMSVFENRDQDVRVTLAGKGEDRAITGSEIDFGKAGRKIWVAVLEGQGLWHSVAVSPADVKKIIPLNWTMPFTAQWRVDFTRKDGLTDSWDMLLPDPEGQGFIKPSWLAQDGKISAASKTATGEVDRDAYRPGGPASDRLGPERLRWTTVLGRVTYPCWSDRERRGFLQPVQNKRLTFDGPVLIYPITRLAETPIDSYTPVDIVRNTLGVGPCQYLLDVEGQKQEHVGRATCHVRTLLNEVYGAGQQKAKRKEIESYLGDALDFVTHIRKRVLAYVAFAKDLRSYLADQRAAHPELASELDALAALAGEIEVRVAPRLQAILHNKTLQPALAQVAEQHVEPTPPALAAQLNRLFVDHGLLGYDAPDWKDRLKKEYTDPLTAIGGEQDEMVGECRWVVKALRQKAGILLATDPRMAPIASEIRARTQKMLRGGAAYEGARH
jgi:hypothetical protein